jgi:hypothetical protein
MVCGGILQWLNWWLDDTERTWCPTFAEI